MEHDLEEFLYASGLPTLVGRLLYKRGIKTPEEARLFLYGGVEDLSSPFLFSQMEKAVDRIERAIKNRETILILGDYDVDGVTSTALMVKGLSSLGARTLYLIPNRFSQGYGARREHLGEIESQGVSLVITVDNGIKSTDFARALKEKGIDLIITDHHLPGDEIPEGLAILDPFLEKGVDRNLAGVGVAFKLLQAILIKRKMGERAIPYLKMVAIGTIADMMKLVGENRIMVKEGLDLMNGHNSHGLQVLLGISGLRRRDITPRDVAIKLSPRINAAGRMMDAEIALRLLLASSEGEAREIASKLAELNRERQREEARVVREAREMLKENGGGNLIFLSSRTWNRGVLGIAALRLSRSFLKPAFVFSIKDGMAHGSGRAPGGISLPEVLSRVRHLLVDYGGHPHAVGLVAREENLPKIKDFLEESLADYQWTREEDPEIPEEVDFQEIKNAMGFLRLFPPFGIGNPEPLFSTRQAKVASYPSPWNQGYKVLLSRDGVAFTALFKRGSLLSKFKKGERVDITFNLDPEEGKLILKEQ